MLYAFSLLHCFTAFLLCYDSYGFYSWSFELCYFKSGNFRSNSIDRCRLTKVKVSRKTNLREKMSFSGKKTLLKGIFKKNRLNVHEATYNKVYLYEQNSKKNVNTHAGMEVMQAFHPHFKLPTKHHLASTR